MCFSNRFMEPSLMINWSYNKTRLYFPSRPFRFSRWSAPAIRRGRYPLLVLDRQYHDVHPVQPGLWRMDGVAHAERAVHPGIPVLSDPRGQEGVRGRGAGQAPESRPRLQVRNRRNTGEGFVFRKHYTALWSRTIKKKKILG